MADRPRVLIVATTGRALAASARHAGLEPLVADCFGDDDTRALAAGWASAGDGIAAGIEPAKTLAGLERLAGAGDVLGVVYGSGLEGNPDLIDALAQRWPLLGNSAATVRRLKDPEAFAQMCAACDVSHPDTQKVRPPVGVGWLAKRRGGFGGRHIVAAGTADGDAYTYYQRFAPGRAVSALFAADGCNARVLGFSNQWTAPTPGQPFRYGGALTPADIAPEMRTRLSETVARITANSALVGLNTADFIVDGTKAWCLEINPRPGATLDIFHSHDASLFGIHLAAYRGALAAPGPSSEARAVCTVFAGCTIEQFPRIDWPDWAHDRQPAGTHVANGDPVCTVTARAASPDIAVQYLRDRSRSIQAQLLGRAA